MNKKKRIVELQEKISELEHDKSMIGKFQPKLIPLYRELQNFERLK